MNEIIQFILTVIGIFLCLWIVVWAIKGLIQLSELNGGIK